jgi:MurNAc alpha-1-phosphate uridylyltransferase
VNGDIFTDYPFENLKHALKPDDLAHLVMVANPGHHPDGDFYLSPIGHLRTHGAPKLTYGGIGVYRPEFFRDCRDVRFPLLPWLKSAMQIEALSGEEYCGEWWDVGRPENLDALKSA